MEFPQIYRVAATTAPATHVRLSCQGLEPMASAAPVQFGGPGDLWSPESLLVAALADCFILTFRAVARGSKLDWSRLSAAADGTLDRIDRVIQFTHFTINASLVVPAGVDEDRAIRLLQKAEQGCLIGTSLKASVQLETSVQILSGPIAD